MIEERENNSAIIVSSEFVYGDYIDEVLWASLTESIIDPPTEYVYGQDENYNVYALIRIDGTLVEQYRYDAYGIPEIYDGAGTLITAFQNFLPSRNPYLFQGRRFDIETGSYHYRARSYNPRTGRFTAFDLLLYDGGGSVPLQRDESY